MAGSTKETGYQKLVQQHSTKAGQTKSPEEQLDFLLVRHQEQQSKQDAPPAAPEQAAMDRFRRQMREELVPVVQELRDKYEPSGVFIEMDADDFLSGGVGLCIDLEFDIYAMRMEGTVARPGIGFREIHFANGVRGFETAGQMLRTRNLTADKFRTFLCERVTQLVRSVVRTR